MNESAEAGPPGTRFCNLLETAPDAIFELEPSGRIALANTAAARLFGHSREELLARWIGDLLDRGDGSPEPLKAGPLPCPTLWSGTVTAHCSGGRERPVEVTFTPAECGEAGRVVCIVRDLTAENDTEEALRNANERLASVLERITDAFFAVDREWRFTYANGKAEQLIGRPRADLIGKSLWTEFPGLAGSFSEAEIRRAAAENRPVGFTAHYDALGIWADVHAYASSDGMSFHLHDITTRKLFEQRSAQAQRLEALGRLAGGVAHDFNNLLTIIGGYGQMVIESLDQKSPVRKDVETIVDAASRASGLTRQLLAFSRRQIVQPKVVDLNRLIHRMHRMLRLAISEDIELNLQLEPVLGRIKADPGQLEQVIMNLAVNARDAMEAGGRLTISTANCEVVPDGAEEQIAPGGYVVLGLADTGTGMDEETRTHMFEPFFTTKARSKGTGLGLATVYGIVKQSGGELRVESEIGRGTSVRVYLPRLRTSQKERRVAATDRHKPRSGCETVLLAEDDAGVRILVRDMLSALGYRVLEAASAAEALRLWESEQHSVALLLTDVVMPRTNGRQLARRLHADRPDLKVLYMSGYGEEVFERHGLDAAESDLLRKPFTRDALALRVRRALESVKRRTRA